MSSADAAVGNHSCLMALHTADIGVVDVGSRRDDVAVGGVPGQRHIVGPHEHLTLFAVRGDRGLPLPQSAVCHVNIHDSNLSTTGPTWPLIISIFCSVFIKPSFEVYGVFPYNKDPLFVHTIPLFSYDAISLYYYLHVSFG